MLDNFFKLPVKNKLFLVILVSTTLVSLPGFLALLYLNVQTERVASVEHAHAEVKVLAQDLAKVIISTDQALSADVVAKLHFFPYIYNLFLFDKEGLLVFKYEKSPMHAMPDPDYSTVIQKTEAVVNGESFQIFLPVEYLGKEFGGALFRMSTEEYDEIKSISFMLLVFVLPMILLLSYLLSLWLHRFFSEPIISLADDVREIAEHRDFSKEIISDDASELGTLYRSVGQLLEAVKNTQDQLEQSEMRLEAVIDIAGGALISIDEDHHVTLFNKQAEEMFGYSAREVLGRSVDLLLPERFRETHAQKIEDFSKKNIQHRLGRDRSDVVGLRKNGEEFPIQATISQISLDGKKIYTVSLVDVTQRRQTERELEAYRSHLEDVVEGRTRELREKNSELEAFSYSIAHDLRAPLRSITSFSQILLEEAADKLSKEDLDHLSRVVKAGHHMANLIDGILDLARVGRSQITDVDVDLSVLVMQAKTRLTHDEPQRDVFWDVQPGLVVRGDPQLLVMLINNLVGNAWKYTGKKERAQISFGVLKQRGKRVYFVRDNGAGFNMQYAKNLFGVFQRMHNAEDFEGTGVGLATVKRIIHLHSGTVWAESAVGEGATFYFTIP